MTIQGKIVNIRVQDSLTGYVYADGLEFDIEAPPAGQMLRWSFTVQNVGDESGDIVLRIRQLLWQGQPYEGDWLYQTFFIEAGLTRTPTGVWGYPTPTLDGTVAWRFSAETPEGHIYDSYIVTANAETGRLTSKREAVIPFSIIIAPLTIGLLGLIGSFFF